MEEKFSIELINEFEEHPIWKYIVKQAKIKRETLRTELESGYTFDQNLQIPKAIGYDEIRYIQGEAAGTIWVLTFIEAMKNEMGKGQDNQEVE